MIIKNIRIIDPFYDEINDIEFDKGKIIKIGKLNSEEKEVFDGTGLTLWPGFIDLHAHFRDPGYLYKEDLETGSNSALAGGYTTVHLMANTKPIVDDSELYYNIMERGRSLSKINILQVVSVTKGLLGKELIDMESLSEDIPFLSDDGKGILSNKIMYEAMLKAASLNKGIMVHAEDGELSPIDYRLAEDLITIRDVYLSGKTNCKIHFSHVSTKDSLETIAFGKEMGYPVTCEVTPHHLFFYDLDYRVNPPIRGEEDVKAVIESIKNGVVDCIGTDHAPHSKEDKEAGAPGMVGLETSFYICYKKLVQEEKLSLSKLSALLSYNGSKILKLNSKGRILPGYDADFTIIDLNGKTTIDSEKFLSKSRNTPYNGMNVQGSILKTFVNGELKYDKGELL